jgi:hypothetical protein
MNPISVFAYEEDGELFVYRCSECGSSGPEGSRCRGHEPPLSAPDWTGPLRKPVRVPGVGEEPRYTLEQVRAGATSFGALDAGAQAILENNAEEGERPFIGGLSTAHLVSLRADVTAALEAALDHFTQQHAGATCTHLQALQAGGQPAGVGAGRATEVGPRPGDLRRSRTRPASADCDGNQQVEAAAQKLERLADGRPGYASQFLREAAQAVRGNQQPQGGGGK